MWRRVQSSLFLSRRRVSGSEWWTADEVRQAACWLDESFLCGWSVGGSTSSCTWCSPAFLPSPTLSCLPFYPSSSVISWVTFPMSSWSPAPTKSSNHGKVCGPQKSSQTEHTEQKGRNRCNICPVLWKGPFGCDVLGRSGWEGCSALQGVLQEEWWDQPNCRGAR